MNSFSEGRSYLLPPESVSKREIEARLAGILSASGYQEVVIPLVQEYASNGPRPLKKLMDSAYKFIDYRGRVMILRPDMTEVVASLAAKELRELPRPLRLFYSGSIFKARRPGEADGLESHQIGAELVGDGEPEADIEILTLASRCLEEAGISSCQIRLGHVGLIEAVMEIAGMEEAEKTRVREALLVRDLVSLGRFIQGSRIPEGSRDFLMEILELPDGEKLLESAEALAAYDPSGRISCVVSSLRRVIKEAKINRPSIQIQLDLGLVRDLEYYTGMVFEAYAPGHGGPVCGGGRYDGLLRLLGRSEGAVGFALHIEHILMAGGRI
ncbi:MAG TPA: hypothetical protein GX509_05875 [Firmicutes bacterium]|nr:hypothetical protein [Bacillota bacterium]